MLVIRRTQSCRVHVSRTEIIIIYIESYKTGRYKELLNVKIRLEL